VNVKVYVVSSAEGLLKLNSNTAGLPSVASRSDRGYSWSRIIIIDCSSRSLPDNSKGLIDSAIVSAVVGTETVPVVAPVQLLFAKW
jgi:hypothetical protein